MSIIYSLGATRALTDLGFSKTADSDEANEIGSAFPQKGPTNLAELLAARLQEEDSEYSPNGETFTYDNPLDRPTSWGSPTNLSGIDSSQPVPGIMTPMNSNA